MINAFAVNITNNIWDLATKLLTAIETIFNMNVKFPAQEEDMFEMQFNDFGRVHGLYTRAFFNYKAGDELEWNFH